MQICTVIIVTRIFALSGIKREWTSLAVRDSLRNEAEVHHLLLTPPPLQSVAHCKVMMRSPETYDKDSLEYFSAFSLEVNAERRSNRRGRKPQVDYALTAHTDGGELLYVIPVEGKIKISDKDVSQLSQYLSTMGNGVLRQVWAFQWTKVSSDLHFQCSHSI